MKDASITLDGHNIRVSDGPYLQDGEPTEAAHQFAATLIGWLDEMRVFAAQQFLETYNDVWREEDDPTIDEREFCARLVNPTIVIYDDIGAANVYFDDSDMFAGHSIEVSVYKGKMAHASMNHLRAG